MFQSEKSLQTHQTETSESYILHAQNTGTTDSTQSTYLESTIKNRLKYKRYIKPLAIINDISFVVIDKKILEQLNIKDPTTIEFEEEITQDRKGILLRVRETENPIS